MWNWIGIWFRKKLYNCKQTKIGKLFGSLNTFKKQEYGPLDKRTIDNYGISFGIELEAIVENIHKVIVHMIGTQWTHLGN